jgi:hypothetical protein
MRQTILALNSESKLQTWGAIGQFGHGGSSALAFCESCLIVTQPRFGNAKEDFYWTLIFPEAERDESKQSVVLRWFADQNGLPLTDKISNYPGLILISVQDDTNYGILHVVAHDWRNTWQDHDR